MLTYIVVIICSVGLLYLAQNLQTATVPNVRSNLSRDIITKFLIFLCPIWMILLSALRGVGTDYNAYIYLYNKIGSGVSTGNEIGFEALVRVLNQLGFAPQSFYVITSFGTLLLIYVAIVKYSTNPMFSLYIFFALYYLYTLNTVRQYIAVAICFYAYKHIKERNLIPFLLWTGIAFLFHRSAIIMLFVYFIVPVAYKPVHYITVFVLLGFITIFREPLLSLVRFIPAYAVYYENETFRANYLTFNFSYYNFLLSFLLTAGCMFYFKKEERTREETFFLNCAVFSLIAYTWLGWIGNMLSRLMLYTNFFRILIIPKIIKKEENAKIRFLYYLVMVGFLALFFYMSLTTFPNRDALLPYRFYWQK